MFFCYRNMAAPINKRSCWSAPEVYKHHEQRKVCISRPKYREGRRAKAVKVYTINLESRYLMVQGVPAIGVMTELVQLCALYGVVEEYRPLDEYPAEEFTEVYLVKFQKLTSARAAKRHMDEKSFYGGVLHVCYVPEHETVEDTRLKVQDRRRYVSRTAQNKAREREQKEEGTKEGTKEPAQSAAVTASGRPPWRAEPVPASERPPWRAEPVPDNSNAGEPSNIGRYPNFPLLPLPPQEDHHYRHNATHGPPFQANRQRTMPTEDKMGTLHNAIVLDTKPQPAQGSSSGQASADGDRGAGSRVVVAVQAPAIRFLPRTAHLESRKRRSEQTEKDRSVSGVPGEDEPLIGPKLPEPPKTDMEDESLNTTANLIRNAMKKVAAIPDVKPAEKKTKPRRRI